MQWRVNDTLICLNHRRCKHSILLTYYKKFNPSRNWTQAYRLAASAILMGIKGAFLTHHLCIEGQQFWDLICLDEQRPLDWEFLGKSRWVSVVDGVVIIETEYELWSAPPISLMVNYTIPKSIATLHPHFRNQNIIHITELYDL